MRPTICIVVAIGLSGLGSCSLTRQTVHVVKASADAQFELQGALIESRPGDVIQLEAGYYQLEQELLVTTDKLTIRGRGHDRTRLSFRGQHTGSKGLEVTGDHFVIEDLAFEDTVGTALKIRGSRDVTVRRVRVEWTGEASAKNGAYGIYPVECENVLIDECIAIGASDAGIYVGQSKDVVVRHCEARRNVAGIEIENCIRADVHDNIATNNTGGILVFDLPRLQLKNGRQVRVFHNDVLSNNHRNFAPPGAIVGTVPPGTGVMVMATDQVEIFENRIRGQRTANLCVLSYLVTAKKFRDPGYDPYPEGVHVHDNEFADGGSKPTGRLADLLRPVAPVFPDIFYDGIVDPQKQVDGKTPPELSLRLGDNGDATFADFDLARRTPQSVADGTWKIRSDPRRYAGTLDSLPAVETRPHPPAVASSDRTVEVYLSAPRKLSAHGLFEGDASSGKTADGVLAYDLNTELFADFKTKHRLIKIPPGSRMEYRENSVFEFPVGTIIAKTFASPVDVRDPSLGERLLETRILERRETGWYGLPYVWNPEQTEATLRLGGGSFDVSWIHHDGKKRASNYLIPNANQCKSCHEIGGKFVPLGPKARNLNRTHSYADGDENQLTRWKRAGLLHGLADASAAPRAPRLEDASSGSVDERARTWLDVNCAHCHSPRGAASAAGLDLRLEQENPALLGVWKTPVAAGRGSGKLEYGIVPGHPEKSILTYRIASTEPGIMMPELPRRLAPEAGLAVVREWIRGMKDPRQP